LTQTVYPFHNEDTPMTVIAPRSKEEIQEIIRSIKETSREIFKDKKRAMDFIRKVDPDFDLRRQAAQGTKQKSADK